MRRTFELKSQLVKGVVGLMLLAGATAFADAPAARWYDTITASGYLQTSYVGNLNDPQSRKNTGRAFDTDANSFDFNTFLLQIAKPVGDDHYGFTARLRTGQDAAILNGASGSGGGNFAVQEGYVTYVLPEMSKLSFVGGKFVTPEGFEGVDSVNNPNFSEGLLFTWLEPITHTGIKANYAVSDKINTMVGVANGWDLQTDNNSAKTILWQVATTPAKNLTWNFQGLYGKELTDPTHSERLSLDTVVGFIPLDKLSLNFQANWGQQSNDPGTANNAGTTHWSGLGLWASYALSSKFTEIVRFEVVADQNGANRLEGGNPPTQNFPTQFTGNQTAKEITFTHKTMLTSALGTRIEYRHDWSNEAYFERHDGSAVRNQNTISGDVFVTF